MLPASCASFRSRIPAALTGELAEFESSEMRRHRQRCDPCHETLTGFETEYSLLSERGCEELLLARLELEQELALGPHLRRRALALAAGVFALAALALTLIAVLRPPREPVSPRPLVQIALSAEPVVPLSELGIAALRVEAGRVVEPAAPAPVDSTTTPLAETAPTLAEGLAAGPTPDATEALRATAKTPSDSSAAPSELKPARPETESEEPDEPEPAGPPAPEGATPAPMAPGPAPPKPGDKPPAKPARPKPAPTRPDPKLPERTARLLARLSVKPGFLYGELLIFPVVDVAATDRARARSFHRVPERFVHATNPALPGLLVVQPRPGHDSWPVLEGLLVKVDESWRIVTAGAAIPSAGATVRCMSVCDPDLLLDRLDRRPRRDRGTAPPPFAPVATRRALLEGRDHAAARLGVLALMADEVTTLDPGAAARNPRTIARLHQHLKELVVSFEPEARELCRRLKAHFAEVPGLRGVALSLGNRPASIDLRRSPDEVLVLLDSLIRGAIVEGFHKNLLTPFGLSGQALLSGREETVDLHRVSLGLLRKLRRVGASAKFSMAVKRPLDCVARVTLDEDGRVLEGLVLARRPR